MYVVISNCTKKYTCSGAILLIIKLLIYKNKSIFERFYGNFQCNLPTSGGRRDITDQNKQLFYLYSYNVDHMFIEYKFYNAYKSSQL